MPLRSLVPTAHRPAGALLLDVAEALHASALTARTVAQELGEPGARVRDAFVALEAEGLIAPAGGGLGRMARFTLTDRGVDALAGHGRFPGDVTVLFTDLVASTQLIAAHGELGAHERRIRHLALLRAAVLRAGGHEVKGLGDGLMVAFADAATACRCADDMQRAVAADADGLGLRVGIHVGDVLRDGDDLHGSTVITASRLCDQADAGMTLISAEVADAAAGAIDARSAGTRRLKGLADPVETYVLADRVPTRPSVVAGDAHRSPVRRGRSARRPVTA